MRHEYDTARRQAENDLAEINRHLADERKKSNPKIHTMLIDAREKTMRTLENLDRMENKEKYRNDRRTNDDDRNDDVRHMINRTMDAINRVLPIFDDMDDREMRRGVPGTGRGRRVRADRYDDDMDDDRYDIDDDRYDDDMDDVEMARRRRLGWRPRRTRRGVGRFTQVRTHVRRMPRRRADLDDRYADRYDDRYDDIYDDDMNDRIHETAARTAAETARHMTNPIYPPIMPHDVRNDRTDRYDRRDTNDRYDDRDRTTSDETRQIGVKPR